MSMLWKHLAENVGSDFRKVVTFECEFEREMGIHGGKEELDAC